MENVNSSEEVIPQRNTTAVILSNYTIRSPQVLEVSFDGALERNAELRELSISTYPSMTAIAGVAASVGPASVGLSYSMNEANIAGIGLWARPSITPTSHETVSKCGTAFFRDAQSFRVGAASGALESPRKHCYHYICHLTFS